MNLVRRSFVCITLRAPHRKLPRRYRHHRPRWWPWRRGLLLTWLLLRSRFFGALLNRRCSHRRVRSEPHQCDQYKYRSHERPPLSTEETMTSPSIRLGQWAGTIRPPASEKQPDKISELPQSASYHATLPHTMQEGRGI